MMSDETCENTKIPDVRPKQQPISCYDGEMRVPDLEGPDVYHVYVGHQHHPPADGAVKEVVSSLQEVGFHVFPEVYSELNKKDIDDGIASSQKTLLIFTRGYLEDRELCHYEKKVALDKAQYRGVGSLIVLLYGIQQADLDDRFNSYTTLTYHTDGGGNDETIKNLLYLLSKEILPDPRNTIKTNMGYTLACSYFYGYLKCILPGLAKRISESGLMKVDDQTIMSKKLFIILPESCRCPAKMPFQGEVNHIPFNASHAGSAARDYKSPVYDIQKDQNGPMYRAAMEFASCLSILWDMVCDPNAGMTRHTATSEMQLFFFYLECLLDKDKDLEKRVRLIYFRDWRESFDDVVLHAVQKEVEAEIKNPLDIHNDETSKKSLPISFQEEESAHLKVIYEQGILAHYPLRRKEDKDKTEKRGKAFVINIANFNCYDPPLLYREGSEVDTQKMEKLFEDLDFTVEVQKNMTVTQIAEFCAGLQTRDFSQDQAVIMCIMSHGILGQVYSSDGKLVSIIDITENLTRNNSLCNKPKIFFIQACQRGVKDKGKSENNLKDILKDNDLDIQMMPNDTTDPDTTDPECTGACAGAASAMMTQQDMINIHPPAAVQHPVHTPSAVTASVHTPSAVTAAVHTPSAVTASVHTPSAVTASVHTPPTVTASVHTPPAAAVPPTPPDNVIPPNENVNESLPDDSLSSQFITMDDITIETDSIQADSNEMQQPRETTQADLVPGAPDFIMSYATLPGCLSYRHIDMGSLYITHLDEKLRHLRQRMPLDRILMKVTEAVKERTNEIFPGSNFEDKQFPFYLQTTERLIYL